MTSRLSSQNLEEVMKKQRNIRNISVIAHVDHGKSTLCDSLATHAGLIPEFQAGEKRFTDNRKDEQERGITIKSTAVSMYFDMPERVLGNLPRDGNGFLVNLIDSPGHVDFSSEVTAALRITDGALIVVDAISGCSAQTETVLRQALAERIKPVLIINKIDRAILEQKISAEDLYMKLYSIIENLNAKIRIYSSFNEGEENCEPLQLDPIVGNVAFGSGKYGWAFTLRQFAEMYENKKKDAASKEKSSSSSLLKRLWNDNFFNSETKKWESDSNKGANARGFNKFVLEPIYQALNYCQEMNFTSLADISDKLNLNIKFKPDEKETMTSKTLMGSFMKKWLPAAEAMLELIVLHLPSPVEAQKYRMSELYEGPKDDEAAVAICNCDANSHLMIYISKMVPNTNSRNSFYALGRVFSGTVTNGQKVRIMSPEYKPGSDNHLYIKTISKCMLMVGDEPISVDSVPCGNVVALGGIEKVLAKSGTISTYELAHNICSMKFFVSAVVKVAVEPVNPTDLPKLIEGLKSLSRSDPLVKIETNSNKQHVIAGAGELHLEICLSDLENTHARIPIKKSDPIVTYKETVSEKSSQTCLAKSANKHNRIYMSAEPLSEEFCKDIDSGVISLEQDKKQQARYLHEKHGFDLTEAKKIWCFGPNHFDANILVDLTKGVASSDDVTSTICAGFEWAASEGVLCQESLRGVRFNLEDLMYHSDPAHRKGNQLMPAVRRAMMASMLTAKPMIYEPVYLVEVQCADDVIGDVYSILNKRRGEIVEQQMINGTQLYNIKAFLPVNESAGFCGSVGGVTRGKAFSQLTFDHWQHIPGDPFDVSTKAGQICREIRLSKNLPETIPPLDNFLDKL